jgi:hypothetical protein
VVDYYGIRKMFTYVMSTMGTHQLSPQMDVKSFLKVCRIHIRTAANLVN